jgi:2,5-diketo-D-gluconate reductase A
MSIERTRTLGPDVKIPYLGFGTYLIPDHEVAAAVREAIRSGYRHIDTAEAYQNEVGVGAGIREAIKSEGLSRQDLFVTTKLYPGNPAWGQTSKTTETTIASLNESLERLKLDYVDLYLIHAPFDREPRLAQWRGLVELREQKKVRAIGVSNFNVTHLKEIEAAGLPRPQANQIELHPWSQKPQLVAYLEQHNIVPIAYSSLVPLSTWRNAPGHDSAKTEAMKSDGARVDSPFKRLAGKYGVTEAQLLLRWGIQRGYPVIPKSTNPARIRENADVFSFEIDAADMAELGKLDRGDGVAWAVGDPTKAP